MRRVAMILVLLLVAAACGDDGGDETGTRTDTDTDSATTTAAPAATDALGDDDTGDTGVEPDEPETVPLTATARGVTADTITVAVTQADVDRIRELGLAEVNHGDYELIYNTFVADLNDRGGINGRMVELLYEVYLPIGSTEAEALCTQFAEDEEVFVVLSGLRGDPILCFTELNEMLSVGGSAATEEIIDRSEGRLITPGAAPGRGSLLTASAFDQAGVLEGEVIAIHAEFTTEPTARELETLLEDLGYDVALVTVGTDTGGDVEAAEAEFAVIAERYRADGITAVIMAGAPTLVIEGVANAGLDVKLLADLPNAGGVNAAGRGMPVETTGVISIVGLIEGPESMADPVLQDCIEVFSARNPEVEVPVMRSVEPGQPDWAIGIRIACQIFSLFEMAATAAGPELTNESFIEAARRLGDISLAAMPFASLGPDKLDANDTVRLGEWSPDAGPSGGFVALTDVVDATP